jgi:two-component system, OmpR family, sensor histidine kinase BaeS
LALAFLGVAIGTLTLFAGLLLYQGSKDVRRLSREQQDTTVSAVVAATNSAYVENQGWNGADLVTPVALAAEGGGTVAIFDGTSRLLAGSASSSGARTVSQAVIVNGTRVGTIRVGFPSDDNPAAVRHLRNALVSTLAAGAGLAGVLAVAVAVSVARRLTRPLGALATAARAVESGDLAVRVGHIDAPGELGDLVRTFDRMAGALAREDLLRRSLVADVAHEVRTPLTTMRASLEGLVDGVVEPTRPQLTSLHDDVLRLSRVVDDLEALASAESALLHMEFEDIDLAALAEETSATLAPQFAAAGVQLAVHAEPVISRADPYRLRQVLTNLLTNALKFTAEGGAVTITVARDGQTALLIVSDTGIGIPPEELTHIFDRFWRGAGARTVAGSGVGLTVAAELVRAHRGNITVDSAPKSGTRVTVSLPIA